MSVYREPGKVTKDIYDEINEAARSLQTETEFLTAKLQEAVDRLPRIQFSACGLSWEQNKYNDNWSLRRSQGFDGLRAAVKALPFFLEKFHKHLKYQMR